MAPSLNFGAVRSLLKYTENELLVGTDNGLYLFNRESKTFLRADNPADPRSLSDQTINGMMWDAEGALWVLTNLGGINYMSKQTKRFDYYSPAYLSGIAGAGEVVGPFCENKDGNIWIGTQSGLYFFNTVTRELSEYHIGGVKSQKYDIRSLMLDGDCLWIGTYAEGIRVLNLRTGSIKEYTHSRGIPNTICSNDVLCIYKDRKGEIFVGTSWGLCRYNPDADNFMTITSIGSMISVGDIYEDMYNNLWIATTNSGVFSYNTLSGHWKHFQHEREDSTTITSNSVITVFEDNKGVMWFGTNGGGLCSFDPKTEAFIEFDSALPNKVIYSIEQDQTGDFWISSNAGIFKINPISKAHFRQFTINDGLQGNQFMARSSLKSSEGKLYFGGINGFNVFQPERFVDNSYIPPVYVTDIRLSYLNDEQEVKKLLQLGKPIYMADKITLSYENNSFTIRFVALSYEDPARNRYSYILKGVDKEWITNSENNSASYTNLPPGEYEFEVRGSNNDHQWNEKTTTLRVVITPPWWRSSFAYFIYILLLMGWIVWIAWRWNLRVKHKYKRRMEKYQIAKEQEVYKSKIGFFINLVHEIRTPLSLIRLPLEKLQEIEHEGKEAKYLSVIDKNVNYLLGITNQLLDFQKMENGALQLNLVSCDIKEIVNDVYSQFTSPAELKGIELVLTLPEQELVSMVDREKLSKILVNLMGNAIKYARTRIDLKLVTTDAGYEIYVSDDGRGVPDAQKGKIFEAFYQMPDDKVATATGTGIGLALTKGIIELHHGTIKVESELGKGSSFIIRLHLGNAHFSQEEISKKTEAVQQIEQAQTSEIDASLKAELEENAPIKRMPDVKMVIVEDNASIREMLENIFRPFYQVLTAADGEEGLKLVQKEMPNIVVSDVVMPKMSGTELCKQIKNDFNTCHIPVVLLTARTAVEQNIEGLRIGADDYITKPFNTNLLISRCNNLVNSRILLQEKFSKQPQAYAQMLATNPIDKEILDRAISIIEKNLDNTEFNVNIFAREMAMARTNLFTKLKAITGQTPNDFILTIRLKKGALMLRNNPELNITEISDKIGFSSSRYFSKCFKDVYHVSPLAYRKGEDADTGSKDEEDEEG